jgi:hypothetical protein
MDGQLGGQDAGYATELRQDFLSLRRVESGDLPGAASVAKIHNLAPVSEAAGVADLPHHEFAPKAAGQNICRLVAVGLQVNGPVGPSLEPLHGGRNAGGGPQMFDEKFLRPRPFLSTMPYGATTRREGMPHGGPRFALPRTFFSEHRGWKDFSPSFFAARFSPQYARPSSRSNGRAASLSRVCARLPNPRRWEGL